MIHGWRPNSVTIHPASVQMKPHGPAMTTAQRNRRRVVRSRRRSARSPAHRPTRAMYVPNATITSNDVCTRATFGHSSRDTTSRPFTTALGS